MRLKTGLGLTKSVFKCQKSFASNWFGVWGPKPTPNQLESVGLSPNTTLGFANTSIGENIPGHSSVPDGKVASTLTELPQPTLPADGILAKLDQLNANELPLGTDIGQMLTQAAQMSDITQLGQVASLGLDGWLPTTGLQYVIEFMHVAAGMPWWMSIVATTAIVRVAMFPLFIKAQQLTIVMRKPDVLAASDEMKRLRKEKAPMMELQMANQKFSKALSNYGVSQFSSLVPIMQMPFYIFLFFAVRGMATHPVPGFATGGFGWITDLTVPDPYYILPLLTVAVGLKSLDLMAQTSPQMTPTAMFWVRSLSPLSLVFAHMISSALYLQILAGVILAAAQTWALTVPALRRWMKLPPLDVNAIVPPSPKMLSYYPMSVYSAAACIKKAKAFRLSPSNKTMNSTSP